MYIQSGVFGYLLFEISATSVFCYVLKTMGHLFATKGYRYWHSRLCVGSSPVCDINEMISSKWRFQLVSPSNSGLHIWLRMPNKHWRACVKMWDGCFTLSGIPYKGLVSFPLIQRECERAVALFISWLLLIVEGRLAVDLLPKVNWWFG